MSWDIAGGPFERTDKEMISFALMGLLVSEHGEGRA